MTDPVLDINKLETTPLVRVDTLDSSLGDFFTPYLTLGYAKKLKIIYQTDKIIF